MVIDPNVRSLLISVAFVIITVGTAFIMYRLMHLRGETVRKFIHITVSNWVFILMYGFDTLSYALTGPILFIMIKQPVNSSNHGSHFSAAAAIQYF